MIDRSPYGFFLPHKLQEVPWDHLIHKDSGLCWLLVFFSLFFFLLSHFNQQRNEIAFPPPFQIPCAISICSQNYSPLLLNFCIDGAEHLFLRFGSNPISMSSTIISSHDHWLTTHLMISFLLCCDQLVAFGKSDLISTGKTLFPSFLPSLLAIRSVFVLLQLVRLPFFHRMDCAGSTFSPWFLKPTFSLEWQRSVMTFGF